VQWFLSQLASLQASAASAAASVAASAAAAAAGGSADVATPAPVPPLPLPLARLYAHYHSFVLPPTEPQSGAPAASSSSNASSGAAAAGQPFEPAAPAVSTVQPLHTLPWALLQSAVHAPARDTLLPLLRAHLSLAALPATPPVVKVFYVPPLPSLSADAAETAVASAAAAASRTAAAAAEEARRIADAAAAAAMSAATVRRCGIPPRGKPGAAMELITPAAAAASAASAVNAALIGTPASVAFAAALPARLLLTLAPLVPRWRARGPLHLPHPTLVLARAAMAAAGQPQTQQMLAHQQPQHQQLQHSAALAGSPRRALMSTANATAPSVAPAAGELPLTACAPVWWVPARGPVAVRDVLRRREMLRYALKETPLDLAAAAAEGALAAVAAAAATVLLGLAPAASQ